MGEDLLETSTVPRRATISAFHSETVVSCQANSTNVVEMDEKLWSTLPHAMLEEILARLPLKVLFQCRVLSREWRWSGISKRKKQEEEEEEEEEEAGHLFEKTITSVSSRWPTYCPVYLFQEGLVGYNSASKAWEKIFDLKMFPFLPEGVDTSTVTSCAGALVCFASVNFLTNVDVEFDSYEEWVSWNYKPLDHEIYVVNVVTQKWNRLPPRANMQRPNIMHLILHGSHDYEVILLTQLEHTEGFFVTSTIITQIYRSSTKSWTVKSSKSFLPKWRTSLTNFVYLDGVFYIATGSSGPNDPPLLMTHDVEKGTWNMMIPPLPVLMQQLVRYHVLLCGSELMLVVRLLSTIGSDDVFYSDVFVRNHTFQIFKLDLASGQIKDEARCPREKLIGVSIDQVLAHGDCIYFGGKYIPKTPMMMYNVRKQEWTYHTSAWEMPRFRETCLPTWNGRIYSREPEMYYWTHYALQPGLNPFAEV